MDFSIPLTFTLISSLISISNTLQTPTITYTSNPCDEHKLTVNSTFEFGDPSQNVVVTTDKANKFYLVCEAPYPVRWLTRTYDEGIQYVYYDGRSVRKNQEPLDPVVPSFVAYLNTSFEANTTLGYVFRCESLTNESLAAEIFISRPDKSTHVEFAATGIAGNPTQFVLNPNEDPFVVPCSAKNIPQGKAEDVKLYEGDFALNGSLVNRTEVNGTYDFRLGFRVKGLPNLETLYECSSSSESVVFLPLNSNHSVKGRLIYDKSDDSIVCTTNNGTVHEIQLVLAPCGNITDCDLKFRSTTTLRSLIVNNFEAGIVYDMELESDYGFLRLKLENIPFEHGFVQCTDLIADIVTTDAEIDFSNKIDYFFRGLDGKKYFYSQEYPSNAIANLSELVDENGRVAYNCKVSPFAIYPNNVHFFIEFQDGKLLDIRNNGQYGDSLFKKSNESITWQEQLAINLDRSVKKIICFAPLMNSTEWARSEILLYHSPFTSAGAIVGYCTVALAVVLSIVGVLWYKRSKLFDSLTQQLLEE